MDIDTTLLSPGREFLSRLATFLPNLLAAVFILVLGWFLARFARLVVARFLSAVRFDVASEKAGITEVLSRAEIPQRPSELIATLVYWLTLLIVVMTAVNALGLQTVSELLNQILLYIPRVIAAVVVLILGFFFANFLAGVVRTAAANADIPEADILGTVTRYALVVFTGAVALQELGIGAELVRSAFNILFGAAAGALALAFGLGGKDLARDWMARYLESARARRRKP
ncbi:MAG: mechanosensitive ion channel [Candidatus Rokubacteria bacterium]|nr:mechanosensitive ion channel [Candidatus Rokubacteria bacterium]